MIYNDAELIQQTLDGDQQAFGALVEKYQKQIHALAWQKIGDFHIAQEITQDVFLTAYHKLTTVKNPNRLSGWLYVIADRKCIAWHRKKKPQPESLDAMNPIELEEVYYSVHITQQREEAAHQKRRELVQKLLSKLQESERTVVNLYYIAEMTCEDIGKFLGVSPNTVRSRLHRARNRLRMDETIIEENRSSFHLPSQLTENILKKVSRIEPAAPISSKPIVPWAIAASTLAVVLLIFGFGNLQYLTRFQEPYSFDTTTKITVDIFDVPIIANLDTIPDVQTQMGSVIALDKRNNLNQQLNNASETITEAQGDVIVEDHTKWKLPKGAKARLGKAFLYDLVYSPDSKLLATSGPMGIWIYDAQTGVELNLLTGHTDGVSAVAFSPDNNLLVSGSKDNSIRVWDPHTGQHKMTFTGHEDGVRSVAFSHNGQKLVSGGGDGTIRLWDMSTGEPLLAFVGHTDGVSEVVYSPSEEMFASRGRDKMIHIWDANTGELVRTLNEHTGDIYSIAYSPDGNTLASGGEDGTLRCWDPHTGHLKIISTTTEGVKSVVFSPDGKTLVSNNYENDVIQFWDVATGKRLRTFTCPPDTTYHIAISPDGNTLLNTGTEGTIRFWDFTTTAPLRTITGYLNMLTGIKFSPNGNTLAVVSSMERLMLWNVHSGKLMKTYFPHPRRIDFITYAPDGVTLACGNAADNSVYLLNTETGEYGKVFAGDKKNNGNSFESVAFSPDGQILASADSYGVIHLWDVTTGETLKTFNWDDDCVRTLKFSPDGRMLVSTNDSEICFWDIDTGDIIKTIEYSITDSTTGYPFYGMIPGNTIAFSPDWKTFVSRGDDGIIQVWHQDVDEPLKNIVPKTKTADLAYAPDGRTVASLHTDDKIQIWSDHLNELLQTFTGHIQWVGYMEYSPDGRTLATAGYDGTVLLWDVPQ